jgi:hypothetical protein
LGRLDVGKLGNPQTLLVGYPITRETKPGSGPGQLRIAYRRKQIQPPTDLKIKTLPSSKLTYGKSTMKVNNFGKSHEFPIAFCMFTES